MILARGGDTSAGIKKARFFLDATWSFDVGRPCCNQVRARRVDAAA
jgi:hypothetical protein